MHEFITSPAALQRPFARDASRHLPPTFGLLLGRALARLGAWLRRRSHLSQQRRQARQIELALREVDAHTLRDLGIYPDEIRSVAAEMTGAAPITRIRVARSAPRQ